MQRTSSHTLSRRGFVSSAVLAWLAAHTPFLRRAGADEPMEVKAPDHAIRLARVRMHARDLDQQRRFYEQLMGLPIARDSKDSIAVRAGKSEIEFVEPGPSPTRPAEPPRQSPCYHFAFNIPENRIDEALEWTRARVPIVKNREGNEIVFFQSWNAHAIYFFDPAGNIVEFIARHTLPNASSRPFGPDSILEASEIGLAVPDVAAAAGQFERDLGATPYRPISDDFASIGDERGLLIVVRRGRKWFMAEHLAAEPQPTGITLAGLPGKSYALPELPYEINGE